MTLKEGIMQNSVLVLLMAILSFSSCHKKLIPDKPFLSRSAFPRDSLPLSEINIPVQVNLKPLYALAEKNVDTVFTSPRWPQDWVSTTCATRYKYYFRRSPLQIETYRQSFRMGFTGLYKIIGSTRVCIGNTVVSPWTPPCRCGFEEGERHVKVNFYNTVSILPDYKIRLTIHRQEPEPMDKCTVCFFDADITSQVMKGLKQELDLAKKSIEDSFGVTDFKNQMQQMWNRITTAFPINGLGWLQINPQKVRLTDYYFKQDSLYLLLGMSAKPVIRQQKPEEIRTQVPPLDYSKPAPGFTVFLDAVFNYDSLSHLLTEKVKGQEFEINKGAIKKTIIPENFRIYGAGNERLILKMKFGGTHSGVVYFTGIPFYNEREKILEIRDIEFDIKTRNFLLKNAGWIFNRKIIHEISSRTRFDVSGYLDTAMNILNQQLNREWLKSVNSTGQMTELSIAGIYAAEENLILRIRARGNLALKMDFLEISF